MTAEVTINLVGDLMVRTPLDRQPWRDDPGFRAATQELQAADLVVANLEMPLSRRGYRVPKWANLRSDPEVIDAVRWLGVQAVTLANNHMMDYGHPALFDTLETCDRAGVVRFGAGRDLTEAQQPARFEIRGRRLAFIGVACTLPMESDAGPGKPGVNPLRVGFAFEVDASLMVEQPGTVPVVRSWPVAADRDRVCEQISALKKEADLVVVGIHWGVPSHWLSPSQGLLAEYQRPLGHALVDAGADVVWGHHSHSLHPVEIYRGRPIFYSLGNFFFEGAGARSFMEPESVIVRLRMDDRLRVELIPLWLDDAGFPRLAQGEAAGAVFRKLAQRSAPFGATFRTVGDRAVLQLE
jgi:poly-gamma-glutamate capsule biosynthesis protein CapA/YwtB (metallophosphatase superfamily)